MDLSAARGTPILAAAAGTVTVMQCDTDDTPPYRCDADGSPTTPGCGWYVDIEHPNPGGPGEKIVTRYCHMLVRPAVAVGQYVTAGTIIGIVGTSGKSSGPHLHYEVHLGDHSDATAVDPVTFMASVAAPLGP